MYALLVFVFLRSLRKKIPSLRESLGVMIWVISVLYELHCYNMGYIRVIWVTFVIHEVYWYSLGYIGIIWDILE